MSVMENIVANFDTTANLSLLLTVVWLIEKEFAPMSSSPVFIGQYAKTRINAIKQKDLIEEMLLRISKNSSVNFYLDTENDYETNEYYDFDDDELSEEEYFYKIFPTKEKIIWFLDNLETFASIKKDLLAEDEYYNRNGWFCIVYTGYQANFLDFIRHVFKQFLRMYIINVNIIMKVGKTTRVYTYSPYTNNKCQNSEPTLYGTLGPKTGYKFSKPSFFKKKLLNMWGCPVSVTTWNEPPFTIIKNGKLQGIEGLIIRVLSEIKNFSIELQEVPVEEQVYLEPNDTTSGFMKRIAQHETNISIMGLIYEKDRLVAANAAYTYMSVPVVVVAPHGHIMSSWERLVRPFKYIIRILFSTSIVLGIIIIFCLKYFFKPSVRNFVFGKNTRTPFTNLWSALYGVSIYGALPTRNFARYILALWILYTFLLRSAYVGQLYHLLQDSRVRSSYQTINDLVKENLTIFTFPVWVPILKDFPRENIKIVGNNETRLLEILRNDHAKIALTDFMHIISLYNAEKPLNVLPEILVMSPITFYMPKHSYLTREFDETISQMICSGFISKLEELYVRTNVLWKKKEKEKTKLSLWLLLAIFSIHLFLLFLCFLIFLLELWSCHSLLLKRIIDFFNY